MWKVLGALALGVFMLGFACWAFYRAGDSAGYERHQAEMAENRAARRAEARARAAARGHQLAPFPADDWAERLAGTDELRVLAETGDMASVRGEVAAFWRLLSLHEWTRKKETAA